MRIAALLLAALALAGCGGNAGNSRPDLQRTLDSLVTGPTRVAPGATAYVFGPRGTWLGAAGLANVAADERMTPDARMRLESVSKLWTATVVAKLAAEHKLGLDDTVERRLPGVFPWGGRMTIRQLLDHTSGLVDDNDFFASPTAWIAKVHDPGLRAEWQRLIASLNREPAARWPRLLDVRTAAALGPLAEPGTTYHYSNIGYKVLGLIAEKASGEPLAELYDRVIIRPLGLQSAAYDPQAISGSHPIGYAVLAGGTAVPGTDWGTGGLGANGGIVASARDEARFLTALVQGKLVPRRLVREIETGSAVAPGYGLGTGIAQTCAGTTYTHNGAGWTWASSVAVDEAGSRVAVLLLNGHPSSPNAQDYAAALFKLFCAA